MSIINYTLATASNTQFRSISLWHISTHRISAFSLLLSGSALDPEMSEMAEMAEMFLGPNSIETFWPEFLLEKSL